MAVKIKMLFSWKSGNCFQSIVSLSDGGLTAFRLKNVTNAFGSLTASMRPWIIGLVASWFFAFSLSLNPILLAVFQFPVYFIMGLGKQQNSHNLLADLLR